MPPILLLIFRASPFFDATFQLTSPNRAVQRTVYAWSRLRTLDVS